MSFQWVMSSAGAPVPSNTVIAGHDSDGTPIYVGRANYEGDLIPVKVLPAKRAAYVSFNGKEVLINQYELLCGSGFSWVASSNGNVPLNAIESGKTRDGEKLYIGRTHHETSLTPGKIHKSHHCLYFPYGGVEQKTSTYEVLIHHPKSDWIRFDTNARNALPAGAIKGGFDSDRSEIYVGRANFKGELIPAKVIPSKQAAYVAHGGGEHLVPQCEVLCNGNPRWISTGGTIPLNAIVGGTTANNEKLYIGRAYHEGCETVGKVHPSHGCLYIPYNGSEVAIPNYEILVED